MRSSGIGCCEFSICGQVPAPTLPSVRSFDSHSVGPGNILPFPGQLWCAAVEVVQLRLIYDNGMERRSAPVEDEERKNSCRLRSYWTFRFVLGCCANRGIGIQSDLGQWQFHNPFGMDQGSANVCSGRGEGEGNRRKEMEFHLSQSFFWFFISSFSSSATTLSLSAVVVLVVAPVVYSNSGSS